MTRYDATPEMFVHRLAELLPRFFGLDELFFLRFSHEARTQRYKLTKSLNISRTPVPHEVGLHETYCRRWPALRLMGLRPELNPLPGTTRRPQLRAPLVNVQRSYFLEEKAEFFVLAVARPLSLTTGASSSVSLGLLLDDHCKETLRFWDDPRIPREVVNLTCERCPLSPEECNERAAPPIVYQQRADQERKERALAELLKE